MKEINKAIVAVMKSVKGIEKDLDVGTGQSSYKGVSDKAVKQIIGKAMEENGLCILPIGIEPKVTIDRWSEPDPYKPTVIKQKQSVFTEVITKYLLIHESGESVELMGYGQGIDSQDKGAGKATTYSLKYLLLYSFLVPTGKIDDADQVHSDDISTPKSNNPIISKETGSITHKMLEDLFELKKGGLSSDVVKRGMLVLQNKEVASYAAMHKKLMES